MNPERPHRDPGQLLRHWLSGDTDRQDERQLDAAAQDDPFLAEALEGYRSLPEGEHAEAVSKLKGKLRQRTQPQRRGAGFYLLRMAAVGTVLVAGWLVLQQFDGSADQANTVAQQHEKSSGTTPATSDAAVENVVGNEAAEMPTEKDQNLDAEVANAEAEEITSTSHDFTAARREQRGAPPAVKMTPPPAVVRDSIGPIGNLASAETATRTAVSAKKEMANPAAGQSSDIAALPIAPPSPMSDEVKISPLEAMAEVENSAPVVHKIIGQVTDDFGEPLTGASVFIEKTQQGTVTDANGYFAIETNAIEPSLRVSYTGYEEQELAVANQDFVKVELEENPLALDEVVVSSSRKKSTAPTAALQPQVRFKKLEKHIERNLRKPEAAIEAGVSGEVLLRFRIQANGSPTDFEVLKSLGHGCDEEAVRVLREGPNWDAAAGSFVVYAVKF